MDDLFTPRESKWEVLQARTEPEKKQEIMSFCKEVVKLNYSVVTRLIWHKILSDYRSMPQIVKKDPIGEVQHASDEVVTYIPVIAKQLRVNPGMY